MQDPIAIRREGHVTRLKWHRARRTASDPVFTGARILEGMRLGASVDVDLVVHGEQGFAVLHDEVLGRESTGSGPVVGKTAAELRAEYIRDNQGRPTTEPVRLLEDLAGLMAGGIHPQALLQLDYKEDAAALDPQTIANFAASVAPVARHLILSSGDARSVALLANAVPAMRVGYDPCHGDDLARLCADHDFAGFVGRAVAASPRAEMIYLEWQVVLSAADSGYDMVAAFHAEGRRIDAYTIRNAEAENAAIVERLLPCRVDQITTDDPEGLAARFA
ncbi:MAG: glycerophosphodiester phosphodiesterase [Rhizobiales bacterium]|nr:glycerophosphodiester phosphodiesterase [Hyphomicrobiales bacterium]